MKKNSLRRILNSSIVLILIATIKPCIGQTTYTGTSFTLISTPPTGTETYIASQYILLEPLYIYTATSGNYRLLEIGPNISPSSGCTLVANGVGTSPYTYSWSPSGATTSSVSASTSLTYTCVITDNTGASSTVNYTYTVLSVTATITNPICYGGTGTASATATGGTSPYTYSWSGGGGTNSTATSLTAGTYTITVTDNYSCTAVTSVTITQPASSLGITISSVTNVSCYGDNGGVIANAATGGSTPYTYSWSPGGGTNLSTIPIGAGTYTITVTDNNGCTSTASATITQPANPLGITINTVTDISCYNGTGTATANTATGGTSPYTYSWSGGGGINLTTVSLGAGTYTITVTDNNGCTATASATITQPANPLGITIASINDATCGNDGNVTANSATGGTSPYTYSWSPTGGNSVTATGLSGGTYTITVTDNHGCTATASATITQPSNSLGITIATVNGVLCNGGSTGSATANAATGGTPPYNYEWSPNASSQTTLAATGLSAGTYTIAVTDGGSCTYTVSVTVTQPLALGINMSVANVNCFGINSGTATASPTGGTSPYTYSWSGGGGTNQSTIPIGPGTYTVTVTDNNNCTATASATITQPLSSLGITILSVLNVTGCSSLGSITANVATGGTSPYTYSWSTSPVQTSTTASSLSAGTYTITVTDNHGCTATVSATITQPTGVLGINTSETNVSCYEGSTGTATVTASGGTSPYTYSWSGGEGTNSTANGLLAGTYTITVEDNNACSISVAVIITQPANPLGITINTVTNVSCYGGTGTATANIATGGTSPYTYSWSGGGGTSLTTSNLYAGTYTITVTDNHGCTATISATITQPASVLGISVTSVNNIRCYGGTGTATAAAATGGTSPYTYSWSGGGGANLTTVSVVAGTYTITVEDNHGCTATASSTITQPDELSTTATVTANDCNGGAQGSALADPSGGTTPYTYSWSDGSSQTTISATGLSAGTYIVTVKDNCGASITVSVIITQPVIPLGITIESVMGACTDPTSNGYATANAATGGTPPYTYSWAPSGGTNLATTTTLAGGTYTITVTDHTGCTASASAIIISLPAANTFTCSFSSNPTIATISSTQPAGVTINWDYSDINGYSYAGTGSPAYLPVWPLNATIKFYADSGTACTQTCTCTYTNTISLPSIEKPYPRWSKRGMYINWDQYLAQLYLNDPEGINEKNIIVNYCKKNHIFYVDMYNLIYNEGYYPVFDNFDESIWDNNTATSLSEFIYDLKVHGGVEQVGVVSSPQEDPIFVDTLESILTYNSGKYWNQKVDVISLDEEWTDWGDFSSCTNDKCRYKWTVDHFDSMHCPLLHHAYFASRQCSHNNLRVEDLMSFPLDPYSHGSHLDSSYHLYPYMNMEIDTIGLYTDRVLITSYNTDPLDQWNRSDWVQVDSGLGRNPFNAYYKKEIWPAFDPANDTTNICVLCHDSFGSENFLGSNMCKHSTTPVTMEQYYFDSVSYSENHNPTPVFTNIDDRGKFYEIPMYSGSGMYPPDTSFEILGCMWFMFDQHSTNSDGCLQNYSFDTNAMVTSPATTLPFYVQIGHDTQWVATNTVPITFKAYTQGGTTPFTYTWVNMENGRIVYYSTTSNTYTIYYDDIANNYSVSKLGVVVTDKSSPVNKATDYCFIYQKYTGTPYEGPVKSTNHPPSVPWRDKWRKSKLIDTLESPTVVVYPNPNRGMFTVKVSGENVNNTYIEIYSVLGQKIFNSILMNPNGENQINLTETSNGIYFYRVLSDSGTLIGTGKLIIEK